MSRVEDSGLLTGKHSDPGLQLRGCLREMRYGGGSVAATVDIFLYG